MPAQRYVLPALTVLLTLGFGPTALGVVVLQHDYNQNADGTPVTDGMVAGPAIPFDTAELFDSSGFDPDVSLCGGDPDCEADIRAVSVGAHKGQFNTWHNAPGPTLTYALEGQSLPALVFQNNGASVPLPSADVPDWDGAGVLSGGDIFVRYFGGPSVGLELARDFTAFIRLNPQPGANQTLNGPNNRQSLFSAGTSASWYAYIDDNPDLLQPGFDATLDIQFGNQNANVNTSLEMQDGLPDEERPQIKYGEWLDIAIVFQGDSDDNFTPSSTNVPVQINDEDAETVTIYVNGQLVGTVTGAAEFQTNNGGINLSVLGDTFGNAPLNAYAERAVIWNEALDAAAIAALSPVLPVDPEFEEADFDEDGDVDGDDFLLWQLGFPLASGATKIDGDYDNDGDVDGDDFLGWQVEFPSPGDGSASGEVPEPATLALMLLSLPLWLPLWRRERPRVADGLG